MRYDLFSGVATMNDVYGVIPIDDTIVVLGTSISVHTLLEMIQNMNVANDMFLDNTTRVVGVAVDDIMIRGMEQCWMLRIE